MVEALPDVTVPGAARGPVDAGFDDAGVAEVEALREALTALDPAPSEAAAIDRIRALEILKSTCAAVQARESLALDERRRAREAAEGVPSDKQGRGLGPEIALARREPAHQGGRHLGLARALCTEMPHTLSALTAGDISEYEATVMVRETAWVSAQDRRQVDELMSGRLGRVGTKRLAAEAKAHAQRLDQEGAVRHLERSVRERRVSVRPAPGGMAYLTALLPMPQAVAAYAVLQRDAATWVGTGDEQGRTRDQIAADLLVERLTGQGAAAAVPMEVHVLMTDSALMGSDPGPAWIPGHGPLPAATARKLLAEPDAQVFLRRLYTRPEDGHLVAMDSRSRIFPPLLRRMILLRDDVCRTPWCDAPIRHADHVVAHRENGRTAFENGSGLCAQCNHTKEHPGWRHSAGPDGLDVTTPTGHRYTQEDTPLAGWTDGDPPPPAHPSTLIHPPSLIRPPKLIQPPPPDHEGGPRPHRPRPRPVSIAEIGLHRWLDEHRAAFDLARLSMASARRRHGDAIDAALRPCGVARMRTLPTYPSREPLVAAAEQTVP